MFLGMQIKNNENPYRGSDGMFHFVYKVEHLQTRKFYIGRHSTNDLSDGYCGSGKKIKMMYDIFQESEFKMVRVRFFDSLNGCIRAESEILEDVLNSESCLNISKGIIVDVVDEGCKCFCETSKENRNKVFDGLREYGKVPDSFTDELLVLGDLSKGALVLWNFLTMTKHLDYIRDWKTVTDTRWNLRDVYGVELDLYSRGLREDLMRVLNVRTERSVRNTLSELSKFGFVYSQRSRNWVINPFRFFRGSKIAHQICRENWLNLIEK